MSDHMDATTRERLRAFCKFGRLFDAQRLLEEVGTAKLRITLKWTPVFTAIDRGFHSLVELLLRYEHAQWDLEKAYAGALSRHRPDLAALILRSPWWLAPIDPVAVLATGDVTLAIKLTNAGIDFTEGDTILRGAMKNAAGTLNIVKALELRSVKVEDQLYSAMITHANEGHASSLIRFLRAGFDPHRKACYLNERGRMMDEEDSAVHLAMYSGNPGLFAALKPNPQKDDAVTLINTAVYLGDTRLLQILLDAGFELNCKPNGGSPALDVILSGSALKHRVPLQNYLNRKVLVKYQQNQADNFLHAVQSYLQQGARWIPDTARNELTLTRDTLRALGEQHVTRLIDMLDKHGASRKDISKLFAAYRMRELHQAVRHNLPWV